MNISTITGQIPPHLNAAFEHFERYFTYPFGDDGSFHVSHVGGTSAFFDAMGESVRFIAERDGTVVGTLTTVLRRLHLPSQKNCEAIYICDLKILPGEGHALARLAAACTHHWANRGVTKIYGIVMDGTARTPNHYSGRCGIPAFSVIGHIALWRITLPPIFWHDHAQISSSHHVDTIFQQFSAEMVFPISGEMNVSSIMPPVGLVTSGDEACGILLDTLRGKRLISQKGKEIRAAHLARFAAHSPASAIALMKEAMHRTDQFGFQYLFIAMTDDLAQQLHPHAGDWEIAVTGATIFGHGFEASHTWHYDSSEI